MKIAPPKLQGLQPQSNQQNFTFNTQIYKIRPPLNEKWDLHRGHPHCFAVEVGSVNRKL